VNLVKQQVSQKTAVLADGTLYLPGLNAGVSRRGTDEPGLMDDQGRFISVYRLFENTPASLFLYLAEME